MLIRLRVSVPDRPGWLAKVTRVIGHAGADIAQVAVLDRDGGRALDEFTVFCPQQRNLDHAVDGLALLPGVLVEGVWPTHGIPGVDQELDLLAHVAVNPQRAVVTLADAVPAVLGADWAAVVGDRLGKVIYSTAGAPAEIAMPTARPLRAMAYTAEGGLQIAVLPIGSPDQLLMVARGTGPQFHRVELARLARLVEVTRIIAMGTGLRDQRPSSVLG
jgi:acetolactate synthase regulatory subunit